MQIDTTRLSKLLHQIYGFNNLTEWIRMDNTTIYTAYGFTGTGLRCFLRAENWQEDRWTIEIFTLQRRLEIDPSVLP